MAISKIKTGSITDSAVNTDKLAPGSVGSTDLSATVITGQTELSEIAADTDFTIIYDTSAGALKKILRSNLKQVGPTISSISPTNANESEATTTFTITGTGFTAGSNARLISNNGKVIEFTTVTRTSTTSITAVATNSNFNASEDPYDVQVTNGEGISTLLANQINFNASPVFVTSAGSLGSNRFSMSGVQVNATDPESAGNVTFELQSGSLPPGISIVNTAAEGGTATFSGTFSSLSSSDTVYNFVLRAVDAASNTSSRAFSFTAAGPITESFTSSGTFSVPSGVSTVDVLVVAGGGASGSGSNPSGSNSGGSSFSAGGGGAGGLLFRPAFPVTPGGTVSVTVGCGGSYSTTSPVGASGQDSVFGTLTAKGGGGGGGRCSSTATAGANGGNGGGGGSRENSGQSITIAGGSATQPTQPGDSGAYGFGNAGGNGRNGGPGITYGGGGGGGAGASGYSATQNPAPSPVQGQGGVNGFGYPLTGVAAGAGGVGKSYTIADGTTPVFYAGGGSGGGHNDINNPGLGGGVQGRNQAGGANTGGGGGAQSSGGKGVVIVRY